MPSGTCSRCSSRRELLAFSTLMASELSETEFSAQD